MHVSVVSMFFMKCMVYSDPSLPQRSFKHIIREMDCLLMTFTKKRKITKGTVRNAFKKVCNDFGTIEPTEEDLNINSDSDLVQMIENEPKKFSSFSKEWAKRVYVPTIEDKSWIRYFPDNNKAAIHREQTDEKLLRQVYQMAVTNKSEDAMIEEKIVYHDIVMSMANLLGIYFDSPHQF